MDHWQQQIYEYLKDFIENDIYKGDDSPCIMITRENAYVCMKALEFQEG